MANVVNKTTAEFRRSVNTPDYDPIEWIINPDLSSVKSVDKKYWKVKGDTVVEMTKEEKGLVDNQYKPTPIACPECKHTWTPKG